MHKVAINMFIFSQNTKCQKKNYKKFISSFIHEIISPKESVTSSKITKICHVNNLKLVTTEIEKTNYYDLSKFFKITKLTFQSAPVGIKIFSVPVACGFVNVQYCKIARAHCNSRLQDKLTMDQVNKYEDWKNNLNPYVLEPSQLLKDIERCGLVINGLYKKINSLEYKNKNSILEDFFDDFF